MTYPAGPGADVYLVDEDILNLFLGFDSHGLHIGKVKTSNFDAKININRLLNKHFAILSISGGGKSYLTSILIEELLERDNSYGTPAIIVIDVHGEYSYLKDIPELKNKVKVQDNSYFQISVPKLNGWSFRKYQEQMSPVQVRELNTYIQMLRKDNDKKGLYSLQDIINLIEEESEGNKSTKQALLGWLSELNRLNIFGSQENPILNKVVNQQEITIFNLANETNIRKKQIIVDYICYQLFYLRRINKIPPFLLIIEEAHQFCPERSRSVSKRIIETIAREGRKFYASLCLISQRPVNMSVTALSQCNTNLILRIRNPYDLDFIGRTSESIDRSALNMLPSLDIGEALLVGEAINFPIFFRIRKRNYHFSDNTPNFEEMAEKFKRSWSPREYLKQKK